MKRLAYGILILLVIYVASYIPLSMQGRYEPGSVGIANVKNWVWTPRGFTNEKGHLKKTPVMIYAPLYLLDKTYWHPDK